MNEEIGDLVRGAVDGVQPAHRLEDIRRRVGHSRRRRHAWVAGTAMLAASLVVAVVLTVVVRAGHEPPRTVPGHQSVPTASALRTPPFVTPFPGSATESFYVLGRTEAGVRLFGEGRTVVGFAPALDQLAAPPPDPAYSTLWPSGSLDGAELRGRVAGAVVLRLADGADRSRPAGMTPAEARLAIQQLVFTAQSSFDGPFYPVLVDIGPHPADRLLGVPLDGPVTPDPTLLGPVAIIDPTTDGQPISRQLGADGIVTDPVAVVTWTLRTGGADGPVVRSGRATTDDPKHGLWDVRKVDISQLVPGTYTFTATASSDPTVTDTRTVVVE